MSTDIEQKTQEIENTESTEVVESISATEEIKETTETQAETEEIAEESKPEEAEEKTASGIILPDTAQEKPQIGEIVAIGPGKVNDAGSLVKMTVKKGDKIKANISTIGIFK